MIDLCVSKIGPCNRWTRAIDRCLARVLYMDSILCGATTHTHTHAPFVFFPIAPAHSVYYVCLFRFYSAVDFSTYVRFECYCCCVYIFFSVGFLLPCHGILKLENDTATKHFMLTTASNTIPVSLNRENQGGGEKWWAALAMYVSVCGCYCWCIFSHSLSFCFCRRQLVVRCCLNRKTFDCLTEWHKISSDIPCHPPISKFVFVIIFLLANVIFI